MDIPMKPQTQFNNEQLYAVFHLRNIKINKKTVKSLSAVSKT